MDQLLLAGLMMHMEDREVICVKQNVFTKGKPCLTSPGAFYDGVTPSVDNGRTAEVIYLDTIPHNILLPKLEGDGFDG